ncbi:unnamed protein product [Phytomonas sp. EM1]|nr:unnamed protein product [Phytomonas sp. EM1]|eukprot:CCW65127.1 unnamed protein product [Phytomonas sp. isolate EM1]
MATSKFVSNTHDPNPSSGAYADTDQASLKDDELGRKISFSTAPLLLEAYNAITDSLLRVEVPESQTVSTLSDILPMPSFLPVSGDDMADFLASSDYRSRHGVSSFFCSKPLRGKDKYLNLTHPLRDMNGRCHSFPTYFPREIWRRERLLRPEKRTYDAQRYKNSDFTIPRDPQAASSALDYNSACCANESNWIPLSSSHGYNQPSSVSSEDMIRTLAHGMALGGFNYIAPLARSQKHYGNGVMPCYSIRSVSSGAAPLWFPENYFPRLDEPGDTHVPYELEQHASCMDSISCHDTAAPGPRDGRKVGPSLTNTKSFSDLNDDATLFHPTTSRFVSRSWWGPPTLAPMPFGSDAETPTIISQDGCFLIAPSQEEDEGSLMASTNPNNVSDTSHYALTDTPRHLLVPFPRRPHKSSSRTADSEKIRHTSSEVGDSFSHEKSISTSLSLVCKMPSLADHSFPLAPHTDARVLEKQNDLKSKAVALSYPTSRQQCCVPYDNALHESSPLAWGQWRDLFSRKRLSRETSLLMRSTTCSSSGESESSLSRYQNSPHGSDASSSRFLTMASEQHLDSNAKQCEDSLMCVGKNEKLYSRPLPRRFSTNSGVASRPAQVTSAALQQIPLRGHCSSTCTFGFVMVPSHQQVCNPTHKNESVLNHPSSPLIRLEHDSSMNSLLASDASWSSCHAVVMGPVFSSSLTTSLTHLSLHSSLLKDGHQTSESPLPLAAATWAGISNFQAMVSRYNQSDTSSMVALPRWNRTPSESLLLNGNSYTFESDAISRHPLHSPNCINMCNLECSAVSPIDMGMGYDKLLARSLLSSTGRTLAGHQKSIESETTLLGQPIEPLPLIFPEMLPLDHQSISSTTGSQEGMMERILRSSGIVMSVAGAATATTTTCQHKKTVSPHASPLYCSISCSPIRQEDGHITSSPATHSAETFSSRSGKGAQSCRTIGEFKSNTLGNFFTTREGVVKVPSFVSPVDVEALLDAAEERMRRSGTRIVHLSYLNDGIKTFPKSFIIGPDSSEVDTSESFISATSYPKSPLDASKRAVGDDFLYVKNTKKQNGEIRYGMDVYRASVSTSQQNSLDFTLTSFGEE